MNEKIEIATLAAYPLTVIAAAALMVAAFATTHEREVDYNRLLRAVAQVESDDGATSANVYQLTQVWVDDISRIVGEEFTLEQLIKERYLAEDLIIRYWKYYGAQYEAREGVAPDYQVLARIHNGGPRGYAKAATRPYWEKVKRYL